MAELPDDKPVDQSSQQTTSGPTPGSTDSQSVPANPSPENNASTPEGSTAGPGEPAPAASVQTPGGNTPAGQPNPPVSTDSQQKSSSKRILFIIGGLFVVGFSALFAYFLTMGTSTQTNVTTTNQNTDSMQPTLAKQKDASKTDINNPQAFSKVFVYGTWSGQTSLIKAVELSTNTTKLLASLPSSIKKVSVLSGENLLYIDQTDKRDHGKQIVIYNMKTKAPKGNIAVTPGFGIDDYVISPDKKYIAIWEVAFANNSEVLQGGKSRVYAVELSRPTVKKLLYDEIAGPETPVHYPRTILNTGRVFADKFIPNDPKGGAGWAYGLSVVDFDGTNRQDLAQMQSGTYGTQPSLSPDGKYLLFSGYDGSRGDGKATNEGYRQALLTPNTVELLDTENYTRQKLANLENGNIYSSSEWDAASGKAILTVLSGDSAKSGIYAYDISAQRAVKMAIPSTTKTTYGFLTEITDNTTIIGSQDTNESNLGNLGEGYAFPFTQIALMDKSSQKVSFVKLGDTFAQYITILPGDYFDTVLGIQAEAETQPKPTFIDMYSTQNDEKANQQLYTFLVKYELLLTRLKQQSTPLVGLTQISGVPKLDNDKGPTCEQLAEQQCQQQGITTADGEKYETCVKTNKNQNKLQKTSGLCSDSPLYLYGPAGLLVDVHIQTPVFNTIPSYNDGYNVTLQADGKMQIHGKTYASIAYDYQNNIKRLTAPKRGTITSKENVGDILRAYAAKLGLNKKETLDLLQTGKQKVTADYAFISFFDQKTSEQILPIAFTPKPDNYLNIVFFFKNLDTRPIFTPLPPLFPEPITRTGFTAVEISEMVE